MDTSSRDSGLSLEGGSNVEHISEGLNSMGLGGKENLPQSYGNQGNSCRVRPIIGIMGNGIGIFQKIGICMKIGISKSQESVKIGISMNR